MLSNMQTLSNELHHFDINADRTKEGLMTKKLNGQELGVKKGTKFVIKIKIK